MRLGILVAAPAGIAAAVLLITWYGLAGVSAALERAGWSGFLALCAYQVFPLALCALAWRALVPGAGRGARAFFWFRWLRDAGSNLLAILPGAGEMLGMRAMKLHGIDTTTAAASTVVDITVEMATQIVFTLLGLAILFDRPTSPLVPWALVGLAVVIPLAVGLFLAQRCGLIGLLERFARRFAAEFDWAAAVSIDGLESRIHALYRNHGAIARAAATHFLAWLAGVGEAGIALTIMGAAPGLGSLVVLESLTFALRSAAFFVPAAAGVQEGGYVLLGGALGIDPDVALALSLLKRGRELAFGTPALLLWHSLESRRLWRGAHAVAPALTRISEASRDTGSLPCDRSGP